MPLSVALYPYLPDSYEDNYKALETRIKQEFEALYPEVELFLHPLNSTDNFYDYETLVDLLHRYDIVEVDSIYLGDLMDEPGLLTPWPEAPCKRADWQPMPQEACSHGCNEGGHCYAYPHWQCAYFLFGKAEDLETIHDVSTFLKALETSLEAGTPLPLAFVLSGSHTIAEIVMDVWSDAGPSAAPWVHHPHNDTLMDKALSNLASLCDYACTPGGKQPARSGFFGDHPRLPEKSYDAGFSDYYIGYSESYYYILEERLDARHTDAIHAPWGAYAHPNLAVDVLLLSSKANRTKQAYAQKFADYVTHPKTFEWMVLSEDIPQKSMTPRYLIPSTYTAFNESRMGLNPMMNRYLEILSSSATSLLPTNRYADLVHTIANQTNAFLDTHIRCKTP